MCKKPRIFGVIRGRSVEPMVCHGHSPKMWDMILDTTRGDHYSGCK
jgi:hypothetical protein